jgi:hypothetical protein
MPATTALTPIWPSISICWPPHLRRIFAEHPCDGDEIAAQNEILASVEGVEGIDDACLAQSSLYHEFIPLKQI